MAIDRSPNFFAAMVFRVFLVYGCFLLASKLQSKVKAEGEEEPSKSAVTLSIDRRLICVNSGESLKVTCSLTVKDGKLSTNPWSLSWYAEGRRLRANSIETVKNNSTLASSVRMFVSWPDQKLFTCVGNRSKGARNVSPRSLNSSVVVRVKPRATTAFVGLRFLERIPFKTVEAFWRPIDFNSTVYTLKYCVEKTEEFFGPACPYYRSLKSKCLFRHKDYYKVPNTTGLICKASFKQTANIYAVHKLYIASHKAGCESASVVRRVRLAFWQDPNPSPNITELVIIPYPVKNLQVVATKQRTVHINWSDSWLVHGKKTRKYTANFVCLKSKTHESRIKCSQTTLSISSSDFTKYQPYDLCHFCVTAKTYENGLESKPVCTDIRLHEEVPADAPRITCAGDDCTFTSDGVERNVTITWTLPSQEEWNGILSNVKVIIRRDIIGSRNEEIFVTNLTKGETVLTGLAVNYSYTIRMVACNTEGCGGLGNEIQISALFIVTQQKLGSRPTENEIPIILASFIGGSLLVFLGVYLVCMICTWVQKRQKDNRRLLPPVFEPASYDDVKNPVDADVVEYEVLDQQKHVRDVINWAFVHEEDGVYQKDEPESV